MNDIDAIIDRELGQIPGWCSPEKAKRMAALARGARLCVELGVFGGRGLVAMALALRAQGFGQADGIDPYTSDASLEGDNDPANDEWWGKLDYEAVARTAQIELYRLGLAHHTRLVRMLSREVVIYYADESVDVLHQDSNHSEEISRQEVRLWAPKIRRGGYWIFDDTSWASTQRAQLELARLGFTEIEQHENWKVYRRDDPNDLPDVG